MKNINYDISLGNKALVRGQALNTTLFFQAWFTDVVDTNVNIEVWVSASAYMPFYKIDAATKTLIPGDGTLIISLNSLSFAFVEFRLVAANGLAGKLTSIEVLSSANIKYL